LVDEDRPEGEARGVALPLRGHRPVGVEDVLEMLTLKFSIAAWRNLWKMRLTSTPASVCG
jgi:hypothetical protein